MSRSQVSLIHMPVQGAIPSTERLSKEGLIWGGEQETKQLAGWLIEAC